MRQIALGVMLTGIIATPAWADQPAAARLSLDGALRGVTFMTAAAAQDPGPAEPEASPVTVTVGADIPTDYYFRGFVQETKGFIIQPYVDVGFAASDTVSINIGYWSSLHSAEGTGTYYEGDPYVSIGFAADKWAPSVLYTGYVSPNDSFATVHELAFSIGYDSPVAPSFTVAKALNDGDIPVYFEFGVEPGIPLEDSPVSLSVPLAFGVYTKEGGSFFSGGLAVGGEAASGFEWHASFSVLALSDALQFDDKSVKPVFAFGFSKSF